MAKLAIVTPSYYRDFEMTKLLCQSVDQFCNSDYHHYIMISKRDAKLFASLAGPKRSLVLAEDVLSDCGFFNIPIPHKIAIPFYGVIRPREKWITSTGKILSGWVIQQVLKMYSSKFVAEEVMLVVDSDIAFVKSFGIDQLYVDGKLCLHEHQDGAALGSHTRWREISLELLKLPSDSIGVVNYVGSVIIWERKVVSDLLDYIERVNKAKWYHTVIKYNNYSEYMTYGIFRRKISKDVDNIHFTRLNVTASVWTETADIKKELLSKINSETFAIHVQSVIPCPIEDRISVWESAVALAHERSDRS